MDYRAFFLNALHLACHFPLTQFVHMPLKPLCFLINIHILIFSFVPTLNLKMAYFPPLDQIVDVDCDCLDTALIPVIFTG